MINASTSPEEIRSLRCTLWNKMYKGCDEGVTALHRLYTGISDPLGASNVYNSVLCSDQLAMALILSNHHLVFELLESKVNHSTFEPEPLREAQVLRGMGILDLGCGYKPTFARCARRFGAEVYTADVISAETFYYEKEFFTEDDRRLEIQNHICGNLEYPSTLNALLQVTEGKLNLVTAANLDVDGFSRGREIALPLLVRGSYWYEAGGFSRTRGIPVRKS